MTPAAIIADARADGIALALTPDGRLRFRGPREATAKWLPHLRQSTPAIVAHLARDQRTTWDATDWRTYFEERAAIREFDGGMSRLEAERLALNDAVAQWLCQNPAQSMPGRCYWCTEAVAGEALLAYGTGPHIWLHASCWQAWLMSREAEAHNALAAMGIGPAGNLGAST